MLHIFCQFEITFYSFLQITIYQLLLTGKKQFEIKIPQNVTQFELKNAGMYEI